MPLSTELAENIVKGIAKKLPKEVLQGVESSASKALKGLAYKEGVISKVVKGKGNWRYVVLESGDTELVDKSVINSLARSQGTAKQMEKVSLMDNESKLAAAYKSLEMHQAKGQTNKDLVLDYHDKYSKQIKLSGGVPPDLTLVKSGNNHFTMPSQYADLLKKEGAVKIIKKLK
jgi:hypothetical protein